MRRSCAIGAAILVGAIGIGLALLNRLAGGDEEIGSADGAPEPIESAGKKGAPPTTEAPATAATGNNGPKATASMTKAELYEIASGMGIKGRSSMNKSQLLEAIQAAS
ncbi:MAG: Rho termination factor N-terminal domain-containing protein [Solirubrobacterales bacterium]